MSAKRTHRVQRADACDLGNEHDPGKPINVPEVAPTQGPTRAFRALRFKNTCTAMSRLLSYNSSGNGDSIEEIAGKLSRV